eukprot:CAMPEP_0201521660 /NCGR_PEP_ID=MMETSP0161_2-20130828/15475_1 /ASSEMBLY_ACC=CAM_ASM_000251 /TAXON_ID=180227 /ORGANISM="Neoparamoeba aestuarina, Strain SoJaBio B1-5/56/2" /LENGTH=238 /DNA_ID=CAMNT_0047920335 /DNA_START=81 /DNA_END=798 /DNA_ORIENTATION=+
MSRLAAVLAFGRLAGCRGIGGVQPLPFAGRMGGVRGYSQAGEEEDFKDNQEYDESRLDGSMPVTMDDEDRMIASSHFQQKAPVFKEYVYTVAQHHQHQPAAEDIAEWLDHCGPKDKYRSQRPYQDEERVIVLAPKKFSKRALDKEEEIGKRRRVMDMIIQGYDKRMVEAAERVALAARMLPNTKVTGLTPMRSQMKKWAIISGPFKFSKGKEHYVSSVTEEDLLLTQTEKHPNNFMPI